MNYELDKLDREILAFLIEDARTPFTEIAKKLMVSPGTIHVRVKKMEKAGIIKGASLKVDYTAVGYDFTAYVGINTSPGKSYYEVINKLKGIPEVTVAHITTGKYSVFCKLRCKDVNHARHILFKINEIEAVLSSESMISLEECINDKERLFKSIFT